MSKYQELRQQAEALLREAEEARKHELAAVIADIKGKIAEFGLTAGDLGFHGRGAAGARGRDGRRHHAFCGSGQHRRDFVHVHGRDHAGGRRGHWFGGSFFGGEHLQFCNG